MKQQLLIILCVCFTVMALSCQKEGAIIPDNEIIYHEVDGQYIIGDYKLMISCGPGGYDVIQNHLGFPVVLSISRIDSPMESVTEAQYELLPGESISFNAGYGMRCSFIDPYVTNPYINELSISFGPYGELTRRRDDYPEWYQYFVSHHTEKVESEVKRYYIEYYGKEYTLCRDVWYSTYLVDENLMQFLIVEE